MHQLLQLQHVHFQENPSLHRQPNTPVGLKQDQSCQKKPFHFIRIFQNSEGGRIHFIPFHTTGTPNTQRDFILQITVSCCFVFLHVHIGQCFSKKPFLHTLNCYERIQKMPTEPYSFEGPWSPTCRESLSVQSTQQGQTALHHAEQFKKQSPHPVRCYTCY